jgi:WD40 repeat protein
LAFGTVSANERWLVLRSAGSVPVFEVHRLPEMDQKQMVTTATEVMNFAFSPQSDELAVATRAGVEFYDSATWRRTRLFPMPMDRYAALLFAPDGKTFWATANNRTSTLHDAHTLEILLPLPTGVLPLAYSPNGRHLAVSADFRRLQVWDLAEVREQFRELGIDWANRW